MLSRREIARFAWSVLAIAAVAGCATHQSAVAPVATGVSTSLDTASITGVWEGQVWEMPVHYLQGVRRITLKIARDGSWTANSGDTQCASGNGVEHRLSIGRRGRDHAQDLARRGLLLQGLGQVAIAGLKFSEQPYVLDGNDRLIGEGL